MITPARSRGAWPRMLLLLVAAGLMTCGWTPAPARAAASPSKFVLELCGSQLPGGGVPTTSAAVDPGVPIAGFETCAQGGGGIGLEIYTHTDSGAGTISVEVPPTPGGFVEKETITARAIGLEPNASGLVFEPGWPPNDGGELSRTFFLRSEATPGSPPGGDFKIFLACEGSYPGGCGGPEVYARNVTATEVDPNPPELTSLTGGLLSGAVLRGHQELGVEASDEGGGVSRIEALVNGTAAAPATVATCELSEARTLGYLGTVAVDPSPCPGSLRAAWSLDTATSPFEEGPNSVEVCASDFSTIGEANRTCSSPQTVIVDNSCTESPVPGGEVLSASFARSHKEVVTVPFHKGALVSGSLMSQAGEPIGGATICLQSQTEGSGEGLRPLAVATTDPQGHFTYEVPPGPNRQILLGYRHDAFQIAQAIRYRAHVKPTLRLSRRRVGRSKRTIRIRGALPGSRAGERVVVLQASALHSKRWFTFRRATTNYAGVFHARYRFDATSSTTTYRIRAVVPRQHGYPWEVGHSTPALVEVQGR